MTDKMASQAAILKKRIFKGKTEMYSLRFPPENIPSTQKWAQYWT